MSTLTQRAVEIVERALFGTEDGDLLNDEDASIPVGEFRRLLHEEAAGPLALLIADAEKRGAAKALERINDDLLTFRDEFRERRGSHTRWALGVEEAAGQVRALAAKIESGEVTP